MVHLYDRYLFYGKPYVMVNSVGIWRVVCIWYSAMVGVCSVVYGTCTMSMINGVESGMYMVRTALW